MGIRKTKKNHLEEHAGLALVSKEPVQVPESDDPLVFWTRHLSDPCKVDLNEFAAGKSERRPGQKNEKVFTGRPALIAQLMPAIKEPLVVANSDTVVQYLNSLRNWWSILDEVESSADSAGKQSERVHDVRELTAIHAELAHRQRMHRKAFSTFRTLVDSTRIALGAKETYWQAPEVEDLEKHIPPEEQRKAVRLALKYACRQVMERWEACREMEQTECEPAEPEAATLWRALRHMRATQTRTGQLVPSSTELNCIGHGGYRGWCPKFFGGACEVRSTVFPDKREALAVFSQCLATTGWNSAVMLALDVTSEFLIDHPKDKAEDPHRRWVLVGQKERAGGAEQYAFGQWRSLDLPGHLIRTYLTRVEPLREILRSQLIKVQTQYGMHHKAAPSSKESADLFKRLAWLRQASTSVWLYVNRQGNIEALDETFIVTGAKGTEEKVRVTYLYEVLAELNKKRRLEGKAAIPKVTYSDFRLWFADYLYRSSFGNLLVVKLGLNHGRLGTSQRYVNTNLANQDAANDARKFQEILTDEMDRGRIDLTILAHLMRHGPLTAEQEVKLAELRRLPKSRQRVGCRNPRNPPKHLNATPGQNCDAQRCLLCTTHAVLLPESLEGIAMREAELLAMQLAMPAGTFSEGLYDLELQNQQAALQRFDPANVSEARFEWANAVQSGQHPVPGMPGVIRIFEEQS